MKSTRGELFPEAFFLKEIRATRVRNAQIRAAAASYVPSQKKDLVATIRETLKPQNASEILGVPMMHPDERKQQEASQRWVTSAIRWIENLITESRGQGENAVHARQQLDSLNRDTRFWTIMERHGQKTGSMSRIRDARAHVHDAVDMAHSIDLEEKATETVSSAMRV